MILDSDLAALYGVPAKVLNQVVKRNSARFPADFRFRLTQTEVDDLNRSQSVTGHPVSQALTDQIRRGISTDQSMSSTIEGSS